MTSGPEYIAERSIWWEEGMNAVIRRMHKQFFHRWISYYPATYRQTAVVWRRTTAGPAAADSQDYSDSDNQSASCHRCVDTAPSWADTRRNLTTRYAPPCA